MSKATVSRKLLLTALARATEAGHGLSFLAGYLSRCPDSTDDQELSDAIMKFTASERRAAARPMFGPMCSFEDCDQDAVYCPGHAKELFASLEVKP